MELGHSNNPNDTYTKTKASEYNLWQFSFKVK